MFTIRVFTYTRPSAAVSLAVEFVKCARHVRAMKRHVRRVLEVKWEVVLLRAGRRQERRAAGAAQVCRIAGQALSQASTKAGAVPIRC